MALKITVLSTNKIFSNNTVDGFFQLTKFVIPYTTEIKVASSIQS